MVIHATFCSFSIVFPYLMFDDSWDGHGVGPRRGGDQRSAGINPGESKVFILSDSLAAIAAVRMAGRTGWVRIADLRGDGGDRRETS